MDMKTNIEVSNDLSKPLKEVNVEWNLYLFQKRYKQKLLNEYEIYKITSIPLHTIYSDIHKYILKKYINNLELSDYSVEMPKNNIGFIALNNKDNILKNSLQLLNEGIEKSVLFDGKNIASNGYILECKIDGQVYMQIFSTSNPIKIYKHKYSLIFNKFDELTCPILTLNPNCDCIIINNNYAIFFTGRAESVFDLEKHYKALANKCLFSIKDKHLFENFETFANYSSVWPKAAKFETFSLENIEKFIQFSADKKTEILKNFNIKTDANGAILTDSPDNNEKALKFICGKYLTDFNNSAYEVTYPQRINPQ